MTTVNLEGKAIEPPTPTERATKLLQEAYNNALAIEALFKEEPHAFAHVIVHKNELREPTMGATRTAATIWLKWDGMVNRLRARSISDVIAENNRHAAESILETN